jgi:hypothetical protein
VLTFGTHFTDTDEVARRICEAISPQVAVDMAHQNVPAAPPHTLPMARDQALGKVLQLQHKDDTQVYKQFVGNGHAGGWRSTKCMPSRVEGDATMSPKPFSRVVV